MLREDLPSAQPDVPDANVGDMISRQAAINAICEHGTGLERRGILVLSVATHKQATVDLLETLPSAQPEPQWIPCSERLPEVSGRYLVTRGLKAAGAIWNRVYIANYSDLMGLRDYMIFWDGNVGKSDFVRFDDVIAWMPLPEPYKEDEHETDRCGCADGSV